ncbi:MAG: mechanosensitive ion channel [Fimbriimonadaceae bacterium]|nr:mechanosensitive ion channel [Fimbriimonadaceae bacterium]
MELLKNPLLLQGAGVLAFAIVVLIVSRVAASAVGRIVRDNSSQYRLRKAISAGAFGAILIASVVVYGHNIAGLGVAIGVAGAGIAFALQEVITSFAGWVAITLGNFYKPGDRVQLGGIAGDVIDIGVLRTTIMETGGWVKGDLYNGRIVRVANSFVFKEPVYNYSGEFPFLWDEIVIPIRQGSDHKLARQILVDACNETVASLSTEARKNWQELRSGYRLEDANVDPYVSLIVNDNWLEYTVRYVVEYKIRRMTKDRLFERILDDVAATGGRVQFGSATMEITNLDRLTPSEHGTAQ